MNRNCVIAAVGQTSLHRQWINDDNKNVFDLHLIVYDQYYELFKDDSPYVIRSKLEIIPMLYIFKQISNYFGNSHTTFVLDPYECFR